MSWLTITEANVLTKLSGPELSALKTAALAAGQVSPLTEAIADVVREVRGYVAACSQNVLGATDTIPDELLGAAGNRIRYELATRLPVSSLLTDARKEANSAAVALFREVAACRFKVIAPTTAADDQASEDSGPLITHRHRHFSRRRSAGV